MKESYFESFDGSRIFLRVFQEVYSPKAIMLIAHGMSEHSARYIPFAEYLNKMGVIVYIPDHRGHGKTAGEIAKVGKTEGVDIFENTVRDLLFLTDLIKKEHKDLPFILMGHSYGSFLSQEIISRFTPDAVILSGSAYFNTGLNRAAKIIAAMTCFFKGEDAPAKLICKLSFDSYSKKFSNGCWLSTLDETRDKYKADPYCTQVFSAGFYRSFFTHGVKMYTKEHQQAINKQLPICILSGANDPVGDYGKTTTMLYDFYKQIGCSNVSFKLYKDARHEILNDYCREEVYADIIDFLSRNVFEEEESALV